MRISKRERRQQKREVLKGTLLILWQDAEGGERTCRAHCLDVSATGVRLRVPDKLPSRALVMFNSYDLHIAGSGIVRFCRPWRAHFEVGIECRTGTGWDTAFGRLRKEVRAS